MNNFQLDLIYNILNKQIMQLRQYSCNLNDAESKALEKNISYLESIKNMKYSNNINYFHIGLTSTYQLSNDQYFKNLDKINEHIFDMFENRINELHDLGDIDNEKLKDILSNCPKNI